MNRTYEAMFLLDNQAVREDYKRAKQVVTDLVSKHGGKVLTARHWGEHKLAYPIKKKNRATYLLTYCELDGPSIPTLSRDLELNEQVLRYLITRAQAGIPDGEQDLAAAEDEAAFSVPAPPSDDHVEEEPEEEPRGRRGDRGDRGDREDKKRDGDDAEAKDGEGDGEKSAEKGADEEKAEEPAKAEAEKTPTSEEG